MNQNLMHPKDQIVSCMERIYGYGMTTTSGGNLSVLDEEGNMWISPGGTDKGNLRREDIVCVKNDGTIQGFHPPSCEFPFHKAIYEKRPDVKAILHAHPPALVSFSIVKEIPDTKIFPQVFHVCGDVGYAEYEMPASKELGDKISAAFAKGHNTVLLENHGIVTAGKTLTNAFEKFETLDYCARVIIKAKMIGKINSLTQTELDLGNNPVPPLHEFTPDFHSSYEKELRMQMMNMIKRSYSQMLFNSTAGTYSVRVNENSFLIMPYGIDRKNITVDDFVLISHGKKEAGKMPSRSVRLHDDIYNAHPDINCIIIGHPVNIMAYSITDEIFNARAIPESYVLLRDVPILKLEDRIKNSEKLISSISNNNPVVIIKNDCFIATGKSLLEAFDRMEVAEYSAKALVTASVLGKVAPITEQQTQELKTVFGIE